jgi:hypothetical protein
LSRLAFTLRDARFKAAMRTQASREEIFEAARAAEAALGAGPSQPRESAAPD